MIIHIQHTNKALMYKHPLVLNGFLKSLNSSLGMIKHDNNYSTSFFERLCIYGVNITGSNANIIRAQLTDGVKIEPLYMRDMKRRRKKLELRPFITSVQLLEILLDNFLGPAQNSAVVNQNDKSRPGGI